jgi:hypothetical protein
MILSEKQLEHVFGGFEGLAKETRRAYVEAALNHTGSGETPLNPYDSHVVALSLGRMMNMRDSKIEVYSGAAESFKRLIQEVSGK